MWSIITSRGSEVPLTGLSISVRTAPGSGMPPFEHITTVQTWQPGARYQRSLADTRQIILRMVSRQRHATLHTTRLALINALNPDLVDTSGPAYLSYTGTIKTLRLPVIYDGGLENGDDTTLELRFLAYDPVWTMPTDSSVSLAVQRVIADADYLLERSAVGVWDAFPSLDGVVSSMLIAADGTRYVGGEFPGKVKHWDSTAGAWVTLSGLNGDVTCLSADAEGTIYAGGSFTSPGANVARWDSTTSAWVAMGTPQVEPNALIIGNDGTLYIGGFDTSSPATGETVKRWHEDTSSWLPLGSGVDVPGGTVHALLIDASGNLLIGGAFAGGVKRWTGAAWITLGSGLAQWPSGDPVVRALAPGPDGTIYAAGDFGQADGAYAPHIARWTGTAWLPLGGGVDDSVHALAVRQADGALVAVGQFLNAGGLAMPDKMARWNGYAWFPLDTNILHIGFPAPDIDPDINAVAIAPDGALLVGYGYTARATSAAVTTVNNPGSAAAYPVLTIDGPGRVYQLVNWTAREAIYFNLVLLEGETLTLDLRPGYKAVTSSFRGNLLRAVVPGSTLATWRLLPGDNVVSLFVDDASASATLAWQERHWSFEGADV